MDVISKYYTEAEEKALFATIKRVDDTLAKRDYYWMLLMRETAIRLGILAGPDQSKVKRKKLTITIGLTVGEAETALTSEYLIYRAGTNKRDKQHPISLTVSAKQALAQLLKIHKTMSDGCDWDTPRQDRPLILSRNHQAMSRRSYQERFKFWCIEANVTIGSPHWLRHTWAKRYLARSTSPDAILRVQAVLGHQNLSTTAVYTRPDKEALTSAMQEASTCRK